MVAPFLFQLNYTVEHCYAAQCALKCIVSR